MFTSKSMPALWRTSPDDVAHQELQRPEWRQRPPQALQSGLPDLIRRLLHDQARSHARDDLRPTLVPVQDEHHAQIRGALSAAASS